VRVRRALRAVQIALILLAAGALALPLPPALVERYYADWFYPAAQARLTSWSNESAISLFDVLLVVGTLILIAAWIRWMRQSFRRRSPLPALSGLLVTLTAIATVYLWFLLAWGLNYARLPLEDAIGYDPARVTPGALQALAERATVEVNRTYADGHRAGFPALREVPPALVTAMHALERRLGRPTRTTPSRPKRTLLAPFFRASGVDGMHAPFLLETLLNSDLTPPERPAVLAHEWAHLAGYAAEDDASFVGLLAALHADPGSQYSAWLALFADAVGQLPRAAQQPLVARLEPGPQADRRAIHARLQLRVEPVARASWETYDRYLKTQGVREGIQSYSRVVQLLLGSDALTWP
jgi:hypothetical protein